MLLANGANPNAANHGGHTPLIYAVCEYTDPRNLVERVQLLLDHGADPNTQTHDGQTALDLASRQSELYSDPDFSDAQKALLAGANEQVQRMDLDAEMDAEMRKTFAEVGRMVEESSAAAKKNFPMVVRMLRKLTKQSLPEKPGPDP